MKKLLFTFGLFAFFLQFAGSDTYFYRYGQKIVLEKESNLKTKSLIPTYLIKSNGGRLFPSGSVFVKFKIETTAAERSKILKKFSLTNPQSFYMLDNWVLAKSADNPVETAKNIYESGVVAAAEPSFEFEIENYGLEAPNDPYFAQQWYIDNVNIQDAWVHLIGNGIVPGTGVKVAIIDDGFDIKHEDFEGRFSDWKDTGINSTVEMYSPQANKHGTACAGIIGAKTDNGKGVAGICPECPLIGIRYNANSLIDSLALTSFAEALKFDPAVISCSWGPRSSEPAGNPTFGQPIQEMLNNAAKNGRGGKGTVIVFAVGNDGYDFTTNNGLASNESILSVGACDSSGIRTSYSNFGSKLDVLTPSTKGMSAAGDGIYTVDNYYTASQGTDMAGYNYYPLTNGDKEGKYYSNFNGTSASAPIAAGIAALIISANPDITALQVINLIKNTAEKKGPANTYDANGFSPQYGYGRINAFAAVKNAKDSAFFKNPDGTPIPENDDDTPEVADNDEITPDNPATDDSDAAISDNSTNPTDNDSLDLADENQSAADSDVVIIEDETSGCGCSVIF